MVKGKVMQNAHNRATESPRGCRIVWAAFENICKHVFGKFAVFAKANHCPSGGGLEVWFGQHHSETSWSFTCCHQPPTARLINSPRTGP